MAFLVVNNLLFAPTTFAFDRNLRIYEYTAEVRVGIEEPTTYVSKFLINGFLKIQQKSIDEQDRNTYVILLSDLKHDAYYGQETFEARNLQPVTKKLDGLQNPFLAVYKTDGRLEAIETYPNETNEIKNIKKSIASGLQSNWKTTLDLVAKATEDGVILKEKTIHGICDVKNFAKNSLQNMLQSEKSYITLTKTYKPNDCSNFTNDIRGYDAYYKDYTQNIKTQMNTNMRCMYELGLESNKPVLRDLLCVENYVWDMNPEMLNEDSPGPKTTQSTFVQMKQTMIYKNTTVSDTVICFDNKNNMENVDVEINQENEKNAANADGKKNLEKIKELFSMVSDYMKENRLVQHTPDVVNQQLLNRIQSALDELNLENLEKLYNEIENINSPEMEELRSIFIQMIPYVGTKSSSLFLRDVILKKKISEKLSVKILKTLPSFIRQPTKELLLDLEELILINNRLPYSVKKSSILSYAYLISRVYKDSKTTEMKLVYLHALGNTRSHEAIKFLVPILLRRNSSTEDPLVTNRLRLAAIHSLSRIIGADDESTIQSLKYILLEDKEPRSLRLAAYDVLFNVLQLDSDELDQLDVGLSLLEDEHIHNYHRSNIQNLELLDALPKEMNNIAARIKYAAVSPTMSRSTIIQLNNKLKQMVVSFLQVFMISPRFGSNSNIRLANVLESGFAAALKYEVLESAGNKIDVSQGIYWYTNAEMTMLEQAKSKHTDVSFDVWLKSENWISNVYSFTISKDIEKRSSDLLSKFCDYIKAISDEPHFEYQTFTSFSIPTVLGMDAIFEHKVPSLRKIKIDDDTEILDHTIDVTSTITYTSWEDGYIGASVHNVYNELMHSVRRTKLFDVFIPTKVSAIYDAYNSTWNIIYAILVDEDQNSPKNHRGGSMYTAVSVMINNKKDLIAEDCGGTCGYQLARTSIDLQKLTNKVEQKTFDFFGLTTASIVYDCDFYENADQRLLRGLFGIDDSMKRNINNCGIIYKISPDMKKTISQIEMKISSNLRILQSPEEPWFFLPGFKFDIKLSLAARRTLDNSASNLGMLNINADTTQGHISSNLKIKFSKKHDERKNLVFCFDMQKNYPNVSDTHLPSEVTLLYTNTDLRATFGFSTDDSCSDSALSIDSNLIGKMSENHLDALAKHAHNSRCAHQKATPLFAHPAGSFPLTWDCIHESIVNTTLRHYTLNFNHKGIPMMLLLVTNSILEKVKNDWPGINIKLVSPISRALVDTMTYEIDYPITQRSLHNFSFFETPTDNVFYSKTFIHKFMNDSIKVTNVFPKMILFDKNKVISNANLTSWKRIYADKVSSSYSIHVKLVDEDKLSVRFDFKSHELIVEPKKPFSTNTEGSLNDPAPALSVYFDKKSLDLNERMFLTSEGGSYEDHVFRLLKVDNYIMIEPNNMQISVYYSVNSVTILREE
ncbi:hypothetical protein TSAR_006988 [Trichomalopsis sarcophagae]|uniref:Vitellogenin domain-containing protein n=1 Tax=Trichomalopsis sarcophagae TaxID=543379 RepID=A0A232F727_9HYME|nr:hypothetical protein TSAR_006988 [Trichomalopsis sarcophagae]